MQENLETKDITKNTKTNLIKNRCKNTGSRKKLTTDEFVERAKRVHGNRYDYSHTNYITNKKQLMVKCNIHGKFKQTPNHHLSGCGCPKCGFGSVNRKNINRSDYSKKKIEFIKRIKKIHKDRYDYSKVEFLSSHTKITIICKKHGEFQQLAYQHLNGHGCPKCKFEKILPKLQKNCVSKSESHFLNYIKVQPKHRYKYIDDFYVDGFDPKTNTIYEFLGDYWHGNPEIFSETKINKSNGKSFRELYNETFCRFSKLKKLGYCIKYIWENDWRKFIGKSDNTPKILTYE